MPSDPSASPPFRLLGKSDVPFPPSPDEASLETFANPRPGRSYWIELDCPEFSSLCPVTGQPDTARVRIRYVPGALCVETKSLKFYLASYRNQAAFNESVANRIADDLIAACGPERLQLTAEFAPRGGISLTVEVEHPGAGEGA